MDTFSSSSSSSSKSKERYVSFKNPITVFFGTANDWLEHPLQSPASALSKLDCSRSRDSPKEPPQTRMTYDSKILVSGTFFPDIVVADCRLRYLSANVAGYHLSLSLLDSFLLSAPYSNSHFWRRLLSLDGRLSFISPCPPSRKPMRGNLSLMKMFMMPKRYIAPCMCKYRGRCSALYRFCNAQCTAQHGTAVC